MMKRNMQFIALALTFLFLNVNGVLAQDRSYDGTIRIKPVRLEQLGEFIHVDLDVVLEDVKVKSARGVDLIPQLVSSTTTYDLPRVSIKGRNEYLVYERRLAVMSRKEKNSHKLPYRVEKNTKKQSGVIQYRYVLPYEAWMADARLNVQRDECGCGESTLMNVEHTFDKVTLERMLVPYIVTPYLSYVEPMVEEIKSRDVQAEAFLDFEVNKVNIRPEYMNNPKELAKIRTMIDDLKADPSIKVNRLDIIGYASPEGSLANNKRLSEGRAMALRDYLATRYDFARNQYHIIFGGENWDGLVKALEASSMKDKETFIHIIKNTGDDALRKKEIMHVGGGTPYRTMLKEIYPGLRKVNCKIDYTVVNFDVEQGRIVIKTNPKYLSLNEMYQVANSYPKGSDDFVNVFDVAVRIYPDDEVANLNAAAVALTKKDLKTAVKFMEKANKQTAEYINNSGVYDFLNGNINQSIAAFTQAAHMGNDAAKANLKQLQKILDSKKPSGK